MAALVLFRQQDVLSTLSRASRSVTVLRTVCIFETLRRHMHASHDIVSRHDQYRPRESKFLGFFLEQTN